jgi:hypothetical protein
VLCGLQETLLTQRYWIDLVYKHRCILTYRFILVQLQRFGVIACEWIGVCRLFRNIGPLQGRQRPKVFRFKGDFRFSILDMICDIYKILYKRTNLAYPWWRCVRSETYSELVASLPVADAVP